MVQVAMIQSFLKICSIGFGASHVVANNGVRAISRWGFWTKPLTILISRIHPIDHDKQFANTKSDARIIYHSHETNFISFIFKGKYVEEINDNGNIIVKKRKWFNYVKKSTFHRIKCDDYVWSIQAGFFRDDKVMVKINNRIYPHKRLFTMGGRNDGTLG
jgi:hypothetical protein